MDHLKTTEFRKTSGGLGLSSVDAPNQGVSFYVERIDLALRPFETNLTEKLKTFEGCF